MTVRDMSRNVLLVVLTLALILPTPTHAYNKSWDQGHVCINPSGGSTGWGRYDYDGKWKGSYASPECCEACCKICPVYAKTGRLQKTYTDLSVPGVGPSLGIVRTYQSQEWATSLFGRGWIFNLGKTLIVARNKDGDKIVGVRQETGEENFFKENADGTLTLLADYGVTYQLSKDPDGSYTIVEKNGTIHHIDDDGKPLQIIDKNGNKLTFEYNAVGCLSRITNASGNYVDFTLGPNGKIAGIADNQGRTIQYAYDANGNLISSTDPMGNATQYAYDSENRLAQITDPRGNIVLAVTYDTFQPARITTFTEKGETWTIAYYDGYTVKTDSSGHAWTYYFNNVGMIEKTIDPQGAIEQKQYNRVTSTSTDWEEDANGNRMTYTYDADGNITGKTDPLGNTWQYTYVSGTNRVETETDPLGVVTKYEYDANGNLMKLTGDFGGPLQNTTTYTYDAQGNQTTETDPMGNKTTNQYDANGNLIKRIDPLGSTTAYTYDAFGNQLTVTDALGNTTSFTYDLNGRVTKLTTPAAFSKSYTYDGNGNLLTFTDFNGNVYQYEYDQYNRITRITDPAGGTKTKTYTSSAERSFTDQCGATVTNYYDPENHLVKSVRGNPADPVVWEYVYDKAGNLTSVKDPYGSTTVRSYDAVSALSSITDPLGNVTSYTYTPDGQIATETQPGGNVVHFVYDRLGRLTRKYDSVGTLEEFTYNPADQIVSERDGLGHAVGYSYDAAGNTLQETDAMGYSTRYTYDTAGNVLTMVDKAGNTTSYTHDNSGQLVSTVDPAGRKIEYGYDGVGNMTWVKDPMGKPTQYEYDQLNQLQKITYADGVSELYSYHCSGNVAAITDRSGSTTSYQYDVLGRKIKTDFPDTDDPEFTYDKLDRMLTAQNSQGAIAFAYDAVGNPVQTSQAGRVSQQAFSAPARSRTITYPGGNIIIEEYDLRGRIAGIRDGGGAVLATYTYDAADNLTQRAIDAGVVITHTYNPNRLLTRKVATSGGSPVFDQEYAYDNTGNLLQRQDHQVGNRSEVYSYDAAYRLTGFSRGVMDASNQIPLPERQIAYAYDGSDNRVTQTTNGAPTAYTANSTNGYTQVGALAYSYDGDGDLTQGRQKYAYLLRRGLQSVSDRISGSEIVAYEYDALGRRCGKTESGVHTQYVFETNSSRVLEVLVNGSPDTEYIYGAAADELLAMNKGGVRYFVHVDTAGSPLNAWDDSGSLKESYVYDPYGLVSIYDPAGNAVASSLIGNSRFYLGLPFDGAAGLYQAQVRMYDPEDGRFLRFDPMGGTDTSINLYQYALNNPVTNADPTGLVSVNVSISSPAHHKDLQSTCTPGYVCLGLTSTGDATMTRFVVDVKRVKTGNKCCSTTTCKNYNEEKLQVNKFTIGIKWPIWYDRTVHPNANGEYLWRNCNGSAGAGGYLPGQWSATKPTTPAGANWIKITINKTIVHERTHSTTQAKRSITSYFNGITIPDKVVCNPSGKDIDQWKKDMKALYEPEVLDIGKGLSVWNNGGTADETEADNAMCH
jgi:RHS repeat-associated protein